MLHLARKFRAIDTSARGAQRVLSAAPCALVLLLGACSSDADDPPPSSGGSSSTVRDPLQPAAGAGGSTGGAAASSTAGSAGGSESLPGELPLAGSGGSAASPDGNAVDTDAGVAAPDATGGAAGSDTLDDGTMTFFVTSTGGPNGGDFGGLAGADAFCTQLATAVSPDFARRTWRAYLSTSTVNARDRIGSGPWRNQAGNIIAPTLEALHDQAAGGALDATWPVNDFGVPIDELGNQLAQNVHDVLTGSQQDGTLAVAADGTPLTCGDWDSTTGTAQNGHTNRAGLEGQPPSWNSVHTVGCAPVEAGQNFAQGTVSQGGGRGSLYCFALVTGE